MLMSVISVVIGGHARACGLDYHLGPRWLSKGHVSMGTMPIWVSYITTCGHGDSLALASAKSHV